MDYYSNKAKNNQTVSMECIKNYVMSHNVKMNIFIFSLFFIFKLKEVYVSADTKGVLLVELTVKNDQRKIVDKLRDSLDLLALEIIPSKNDVLKIKATATEKALHELNKARIHYIEPDQEPGLVNNEPTFKNDVTYEEIQKYLGILSSKSTPQRKITVEQLGKSFQGRDLHLVKIEHPKAKNIMFFDACTHAREWLSLLTGLHLIKRLIAENYTTSINGMNWYIIPIVNPDGYVYSYTKKRYQRKNMNSSKSCLETCDYCGVDLNRNYEYKWGVNSGKGSCSDTYRGDHPFSEKETQAVSGALLKYRKNIKLYVALHTFGCKILYPWGYEEIPCGDAKDLIAVAQPAVEWMNKNKYKHVTCDWTVQNAGSLGGGGGGADDYAKGTLRIKYSYTMELQGGRYHGWNYVFDAILDYVSQSYRGIVILAENINDRYNKGFEVDSSRNAAERNQDPHLTLLLSDLILIFLFNKKLIDQFLSK